MDSEIHPVIRRLVEDGRLRCPKCAGSILVLRPAALRCTSCDAVHPVLGDVLDLHGFSLPAEAHMDEPVSGLSAHVARVLALDEDDVDEILRHGRGTTAGSAPLDAEILDIADRFGMPSPSSPDRAPIGLPDDADLIVEWHCLPSTMLAGARLHCNVRLRNRGTVTISSDSRPPVNVGARWLDRQGQPVAAAETRVRFPLPIAPARAITIPVPVDAPSTPGTLTLEVSAVIEGRRWLRTGGAVFDVAIVPSAMPAVALPVEPRPPLPYAEEHQASLSMLSEAASDLLIRPQRRLLEIGGGAAPQLAWLGHDLVNVDISLPLLQLGSLWYRTHADQAVGDHVAFVGADASDLPFADATFDAVVMFATLHHFPEPERLLRTCRRLVRPDGVVAVLCEPVSETLEQGDVIRDLRKGINEQVFSVEEYVRIAGSAGLAPTRIELAGGSLRLLLAPAEPSGERFDIIRRPTQPSVS